MYILAVNISHHASVCLLKDGEIVFFLEEERVSKIKHHGVGVSSILKALNYLPVSKVDYLVIIGALPDNYHYNSAIVNNILQFEHENYITYQEHHLFHAANSFYNSGFDNAVSLILDGGGWVFRKSYFEVESIYNCSYNNFDAVYKHYSSKNIDTNHTYFVEHYLSDSLSCGNMFRRFTKLVGLGYETGKFMGMSTYGSNTYEEEWFYQDFNTSVWRTDNSVIKKELQKPYNTFSAKANLAYKVQQETKKHTIRLLEKCFEHNDNVVLSGGYFQNCVNNYEYIKTFPTKKFYIDPVCHDGGTSIGAAKYLWHQITNDKTIRKLPTLYLG